MSTADVISARRDPAPPPGQPAAPVMHWIRFLRSELRLIFLRWRNLALLRSPIAWPDLEHGLTSFGLYVIIFGGIAWARFSTADVTS